MSKKLFCLHFTPDNDHGCQGEELVIRPTSPTQGIVQKVSCCTSCWQRGCTPERLACLEAEFIGQTVSLPDWCASWEEAATWEENDNSFSCAGRTYVAPADLAIVTDDDPMFYVSSRYGTGDQLDMAEYTEELHEIILSDQVREFTLYGPDRVTPMGRFYKGEFYPDARTYAEAAGVDTRGW
jgi:hypothetical protein